MSQYKHIVAAFSLIILILATIGGSSVYLFRDIARNADNLYKHPFAVSNAAKSINYHLASMESLMKEIVLTQTPEQQLAASSEINRHEQEALRNFEIIFERFLGEKSQINRTYQVFIAWKPIREEVIHLTRQARLLEAADLVNIRGAEHVAKLDSEVEELVDFAFLKAKEFHRLTSENERRALILLISLSVAGILASLLIAIYVVQKLLRATKNNAQREHLIDQNIMMASLDLDGNVTDISNALCRFLGQIKQHVIGKPSEFFDNSGEPLVSKEYIWQTIQTGKYWSGEIKYIKPTGKAIWARSSIIPIFNDAFQLTGFTNILSDITSEKLSVTDKLTTLFNRRQYEEIITREMRLAKRNSTFLTLAIADIDYGAVLDYFKFYNDNYGHPKGDIVLSNVAKQMLSSMKRPNDYVFRIGGEEFAFVFSNLNQQGSQDFLDDIRRSVENLNIMHEHSDISDHVTISIGGYIIAPNSELTEEQAYEMADKALYKAKEKRNHVVVTS